MVPSWTVPIPQAMQQHRGSQSRKPDTPQREQTGLVPADAPVTGDGSDALAPSEGRTLT